MKRTEFTRRILTWVVVGSAVAGGLLLPALLWADKLSTVEINDSTVSGPILSDGDRFGSSVANIGDLNNDGVADLAVGAAGDDDSGTNRGVLHIMFMNSDVSIESTIEINDSTVNGPVLSDGDRFGSSVANIGDLDGDGVADLVVGAAGDDDSGTNRGALHIMFMNSDVSIDSTIEINDSTVNGPVLSDGDRFGISVANIGDLNNDGVDDLAVGAARADDSGVDRGAVHILFMNTDGSIDSTIEINDSTANGPVLANGDRFGSSVANIGDLDGDGVADLAIGAARADDSGVDRGALHILFMNTDGSIDSTVEINDSTANGPILANDDRFGMSIANIGDLNNDGVADLVVGATGDDNPGVDRGALYILYMNTDGSIDSTIEINDSTANGPVLSNGDRFGSSVANIGDLNNDGVADLAVGAAGDDNSGPNRGALHGLLLPSKNFARKIVIPITNIKFNKLGDTTTVQLPSGRIKVATVGLEGQGIFNCNGDPDCEATGLDWQQIDIRLDLQLLLSNDSDDPFKNAKGRARGEVGIYLPNGESRTLVFTTSRIHMNPGNIGKSNLKFRMRVSLRDRGGRKQVARLEFVLKGVMAISGTSGAPVFTWNSIVGSGVLALGPEEGFDNH